MLHQFIDPFLQMIKDAVASWGYLGVVVMMAIESANIPLPSEAIMPTAGLLVQQGKMNIHLAALAGAIGCLLGSIPSYFLGLYGGRPFLQKYGRYLLLKGKDLETADRWVDKYGDGTFCVQNAACSENLHLFSGRCSQGSLRNVLPFHFLRIACLVLFPHLGGHQVWREYEDLRRSMA